METENKQFQKGIDEVREVQMSQGEKTMMLKAIMGTKKSPYAQPTFYAHRMAYSFAIVMFVFVTGGGSAAFASLKSLPGDILYPFKTKVVEPVTAAFIFSPEKRVHYETSLVVARLMEAETLSNENRLDMKKEDELKVLLAVHANTVNENVEKLRQAENKKGADDLVVNFQTQVTAHTVALDTLTKEKESAAHMKQEDLVVTPEDPTNNAATNNGVAPDEIAPMSAMMFSAEPATLNLEGDMIEDTTVTPPEASMRMQVVEDGEEDAEEEKIKEADRFLKKILNISKKDRDNDHKKRDQ